MTTRHLSTMIEYISSEITSGSGNNSFHSSLTFKISTERGYSTLNDVVNCFIIYLFMLCMCVCVCVCVGGG